MKRHRNCWNNCAQKLATGVLPGTPIVLHRRVPSFVFEAGYSQFAVDEQIAADIYVRVAQPQTL